MFYKKIILPRKLRWSLVRTGWEFRSYENQAEAQSMERLFSSISLPMIIPFMSEESTRRYVWLRPKGRRVYQRAG